MRPYRGPGTSETIAQVVLLNRRGESRIRAMRKVLKRTLKVALILFVLIALALGAAFALTDPNPATIPRRAGRWLAEWSRRPSARTTLESAKDVPLYSMGWFEDSGYQLSIFFSTPITDPTSLTQVRDSSAGRGFRGARIMSEKLAALRGDDPTTPLRVTELEQIIGGLLMYEGKFEEAEDHFARSQAADPSKPETFRANMEALRGVAALRRGEVENCVACCNEASCIYPLAPAAVHRRTAGSRAAIGHFTRYLRTRPEDMGIRWLLNLAYMTLGEYPQGVPQEYLLPLGRFAATDETLPQRMVNIASRVGLNVRGEAMAGGCIVDDFDGDSLLDMFTTTTDTARGASLLRNRGDGTFEDRSKAAGLDGQIQSLNACQADYDNDGDLDILMLRGGWELPRRLTLLRNRGDGSFDDVTVSAGLGEPIATQAAGWADYDNDGLVDLYVAGEFSTNSPSPLNRGRLYRNRGDGTFINVAESAGVLNDRLGKGVAWGDYDNDGRPDLYVSNLNEPNRLYHNTGDGTFVDRAEAHHVTEPLHSFACWFWDYDNDGRLDLWVNPYGAFFEEVIRDQFGQPTTGERPRLYRNVGPPEWFRDVTKEVGLDRVVMPMGSNFGDVENDGFLDIYLGTGRPEYSFLEPNLMFRNHGGRRFEDVTAATGTGHLQKGHGVAFADWDRDGDLDLFLESGGAAPGDRAHNVLFQNPGHGNHWLTVKLVGTKTNRAALGARIRVDLPGTDGAVVSRFRTITSGSSFGGNPLVCTVGLASASTIHALEVFWPATGIRQSFRAVPVDRSIVITEGQNQLRVLDAPPIRTAEP
jgi:hypothetical protein